MVRCKIFSWRAAIFLVLYQNINELESTTNTSTEGKAIVTGDPKPALL